MWNYTKNTELWTKEIMMGIWENLPSESYLLLTAILITVSLSELFDF